MDWCSVEIQIRTTVNFFYFLPSTINQPSTINHQPSTINHQFLT